MEEVFVISCSVALVLLTVLSAFFSASETAYTSVSRIRLKNLVNDGNRKAEKALKLSENYENLLTTILVGNNLVNILASSICTWLFAAFFGDWSVIAATLFMLIVLLTFGEITPKTVAKRHAEKVAMLFARPLSFVMVILYPISFCFKALAGTMNPKDEEEQPTLTEEELSVMIDEIEGEGVLEKSESELIKSAMEFDDKQVSEILTPRVDIVAVEKSASMEDLKKVLLSSGFSRIPVYDGTIDRIIGVIYAKDFYSRYFEKAKVKMEDLMRPVKFIPETTTVARTLTEIQKSMVQMVVVVDAYGGTVGIVSLEDILEELVGEIWDESDEVQYSIVRESDGSYAVLGEANIFDMMEEIGLEFDTGDYDGHTVGGYIQYRLNRIPVKGDRVENDEVKMIVRTVRNRRVKMVQVTLKKEPEQREEASE